MLDLSFGVILSGLVLGGAGFALFLIGKRNGEPTTILGGLALSVLPMFVHALVTLWLLSAAVIGAMVLLRRTAGTGAPLA
ncbi:MAG: hypothetical protein ACTS22_08610 [Phycisphaerales bacterium]